MSNHTTPNPIEFDGIETEGQGAGADQIPQMPAWNGFMLHVLRYLSDGATYPLSEVRKGVENLAQLTQEQRSQQLQSGQSRANNRIGWAVSYLARVDAIERPTRGHYRITSIGRDLIARYPDGITESVIRAIAKPGDTWAGRSAKVGKFQPVYPEPQDEPLDPVEQIEEGLGRIHTAVAADLLARLQSMDPTFFEQAVVKLLVAMGYGGADRTATVTQQSHDGGIDGVIDRDALGLDRVYIQAKRYAADNSVQAPAVQAFVGALSGKAPNGVFILLDDSQVVRSPMPELPTPELF